MRKLIVISGELHMRNFVRADAFSELEDDETHYLVEEERHARELRAHGMQATAIDRDRERDRVHKELREVLLVSLRFRSQAQRIGHRLIPLRKRWRYDIQALPLIRNWLFRRAFKRLGPNPLVEEVFETFAPQLVIAPSAGTDPMVTDATLSARARSVPAILVAFNWDNLSSKGGFLVAPDYLAVVGEQSAEHARRILRFPRNRTRVIGSPYVDAFFRYRSSSTSSPFPFPYALFAGCYKPFDELTALKLLEQAIEDHGLDLKIVYRPHPLREVRDQPDFVVESQFKHVVIDPQVKDQYLAEWNVKKLPRGNKPGAEWGAPDLDYYPPLLQHARFVISPLSTLVLEAAIFRRKVIAIAYHDGIHKLSPAVAIRYDHYAGIDEIGGVELCRNISNLVPMAIELARNAAIAPPDALDAVRRRIYCDEHPYAQRLANLVREVVRSEELELTLNDPIGNGLDQ